MTGEKPRETSQGLRFMQGESRLWAPEPEKALSGRPLGYAILAPPSLVLDPLRHPGYGVWGSPCESFSGSCATPTVPRDLGDAMAPSGHDPAARDGIRALA